MFNGLTGLINKNDSTKKKENKKVEDNKMNNNNVKVPDNYQKLPGMDGIYFEILDD